jgi:hypothetical protein
MHDLKALVIDGDNFSYFYTRDRNDVNGNPRFRVYIIDPDCPAVHETIFGCYESQISERVRLFIETEIGSAIPF